MPPRRASLAAPPLSRIPGRAALPCLPAVSLLSRRLCGAAAALSVLLRGRSCYIAREPSVPPAERSAVQVRCTVCEQLYEKPDTAHTAVRHLQRRHATVLAQFGPPRRAAAANASAV